MNIVISLISLRKVLLYIGTEVFADFVKSQRRQLALPLVRELKLGGGLLLRMQNRASCRG